MKRLISLTLLLSIFLTACGASSAPTPASAAEAPTLAPTEVPPTATPEPEPQTLTVFAAASLTDAFIEIGAAFDAANPGVTTTFNFGGSQTLRTQIEEGAPVDVFASANAKEMDTLVTDNFVTADIAQVFLTNKLVVILPADNPAALEKLEDLANPGIKLVLAAEEVPVGKYSRQAFDLMDASFGTGFKDKVLANVVSNEDNVKQVVAKIQLGEADAGIVYTSDAIAAPDLKTIEIPADLNVIAKYPIAPLVNSENTELAAQFIEYVLSAEGQSVLAKWGFAPIK
ncbi:MAG: molybdate ABC transporter substrate-binding protein [Anaerolineales bacterium]|uniref:molybdate ABC transporter substrate-binding protein n=1 Tax=Candidatus Villigracilis proximus TaxID=3140683 RepID=UPI003136BF4D|nr:molybdate ABC transporter substrate-binding protein [Anaerolineales bacterium]